MSTNKLVQLVVTIGFFLLSLMPVYAANNGVPDNRTHQFAAYLGIPNEEGAVTSNCKSSDVIYYSCGAYLVDPVSIGLPKSLDRRILVTAGHCVVPRDNAKPFVVSFQDGDARVTGADTGCPTRAVGFKPTGFNYYYGTNSWTNYTYNASGVGVGVGKNDFGIILLNTPVSASDVDKLAKIATTRAGKALPINDVSVLGMAGFGIAGFGDPNQKNGMGKPIVINGLREKMYVEMPTLSVQNWNISSQMNAAQAEQLACNGDSGSALFLPNPDVNGIYSVYAHVANGDYHCRATNTSTRVDTQDFRDFVAKYASDISAAAGL